MVATRERSEVMTVDAGLAALIIRTIKPIIDAVRTEYERDDLPPYLKEVLMKKRLSLEMLVHILRGNKSAKQKFYEDKERGYPTENEIDVDTWVVHGSKPWETDGDVFSLVYGEEAADREVAELEAEGYVTTKFRVVPYVGRDIEVFWPVVGEELEQYRKKDAEIQAYRASRGEEPLV